MAAGAWTVYNLAKKKIGNGTLSLASTAFRCTLHTSASNAQTATLGVYASLTGEVTSVASSYSSSGKALANEVWTVGSAATKYKFDADDPFWSAASQISNIKTAVIWISGASANGRHLLAYCGLSTSQFNLAAGNRLTITMPAAGILTLQ